MMEQVYIKLLPQSRTVIISTFRHSLITVINLYFILTIKQIKLVQCSYPLQKEHYGGYACVRSPNFILIIITVIAISQIVYFFFQ